MNQPISQQVEDAVTAAKTHSEQISASDIIRVLDLTTLGDLDTAADIRRLCARAIRHEVAAVCVYPRFVRLASELLHGTDVRVATVSVDFPHGQSDTEIEAEGVRRAVADGAHEVDIVARRGEILAQSRALADQTSACVVAASGAHIKVILETGQLNDVDTMYRAAREALAAGAHFVKTSTGKSQPAATPQSTAALLLAIRDHAEQTGVLCGCKPAGGIRTYADAALLMSLANDIAGIRPGDATRFRIGASSLLDALL